MEPKVAHLEQLADQIIESDSPSDALLDTFYREYNNGKKVRTTRGEYTYEIRFSCNGLL